MSRASKYTYPGTDVLINHFDIRDRDVLQAAQQHSLQQQQLER